MLHKGTLCVGHVLANTLSHQLLGWPEGGNCYHMQERENVAKNIAKAPGKVRQVCHVSL